MARPRSDGSKSNAPNRRKLSDSFIKNIDPETRPFLVWDSVQRGLALSVQPSGQRAFKVIYSFHGRPRWYHLGAADAITLADARKLASRVMFRVAEGSDPQAERRAERGAGTFEELATRYVTDYSKRNNKSWEQADKLVRKHLLPKWGKLQAANITRSDMKATMARIDAPVVANQVLAAAAAIFSWAIREEIAGIKINPATGVERNAVQSRERVLSDSEIPKFWTAFDDAGLVEGAALKALLFTGQRPGEITHMRTEHIIDGCWWEMPGAPVPKLGWPGTKNGQTHRVYLPKIVQDIIAELQPKGLVFAGARGRAIRLTEAMAAICKKLGVVRATPHDLRRSHGTLVTRLGFGRDAMNRIQNHREGGIASVYDRHEYADENKRIMEAVAAKLMTLIEGKAAKNVIAFGKAK
jgi:integrase